MARQRPARPALKSDATASTAVLTPDPPVDLSTDGAQTIAVPGDKKRFVPAGRRGGFGRQKGTPNRATRETKENIRKFLSDETYQSNLMYRIESGQAQILEKYLWEIAYGKPKVVIELPAPPGVPIGSLAKNMSKAELRLMYALMKRLRAATAQQVMGRVIDAKALPLED